MKTKGLDQLIQSAHAASEGLKALAHPTRLLAVCHIGDGEKAVGELEQFLGASQSAVSQHLGKLRDKGILTTRKDGNQVYYRIRDKKVLNLIGALQALYCD